MHHGTMLAYGALGLPLAFAALPLYVHVPRYYAETVGMNLALLGSILLATRLLDALVDPWLGWLADRLPRRRLLLLALLPFAAGFAALFGPPQGSPAVWLIASLTLTYLGFSAASVAYQAWGAAIGRTSAERTRLTATREGFGLIGVVLASALPSLLSDDPGTGTERMAMLLPPLLLVSAALTLSSIRHEGSTPDGPRPSGHNLRDVLENRPFRRLLGVFVANGIAAALPATLFLFFVADVLGAQAASGPLLALYFISGAVSLPCWVRLAHRYGRVRSWALGMVLAMLAFGGAGLLDRGDELAFGVICLASGLALGADLALPAAMAADLGERHGQSGTVFGIWNFIAKLNLALAAGMALPLLDLLGYRPGGTESLEALTFGYAILPLAFKLLAAGLLWRWRNSLEIRS